MNPGTIHCKVNFFLLSRMDEFHLNHAVKPLRQLSASVSVMSRLRFTVGFNVLSRYCGTSSFGMRFAGVGFKLWFGVVLVANIVSLTM